MSRRYSIDGIDLTGKTAVVTGATSGIGFETARAFARMGAAVILSGRRVRMGQAAVDRIAAESPTAPVSFLPLDVADLSSVAAFAEQVAARSPSIDILVNNAGVAAVPGRMPTADGFELQFGTNYLGHFALTGRLLPNLIRAGAARVVSLSSISHHAYRIHLDDLQLERGYRPWTAYGQSKLAMLMFAIELQRRADANGWGLLSLAAHPGLAVTELASTGPGLGLARKSITQRLLTIGLAAAGQSAAAGAMPAVAAATAWDVRGGAHLGPGGWFELRGPPARAWKSERAKDPATAAELWRQSELLTGVRFPSASGPAG